MGSLTDALEKEILDHILKTGSYAPPSTVYLGLSTADPLDSGSGLAEPSGNGYARKAISFGGATGRAITQDADVTFDQATGSWGTITHYGLFTLSTGGVLMAHGSLNTSKAVIAGNTPSVASGEVIVSVSTGGMSTTTANTTLDWLFDAGTFSQPTNLYVALCSADIVDGDTGSSITELVMTNYARENHNVWNAATGDSPSTADNNGTIDFGSLTGTGETCEAAAILDADTAGNVLFYSNTPSQAIGSGDTVQIASGAFDVTCD